MSVANSAGPQVEFARGDAGRPAGDGWSNVRPLDRGSTGAVGEWIDLLASISHELRTPLNAVIGFSDAMQQEVFGPIGNVRYQEYVRHIRSSGVELLAAAEDALAMTAVLAQPRSVSVEDVALAPLVEAALADLPLSGRHVSLEIEVGDIEVRADRRVLARAIRQMVAISRSRAAPGSVVRISATGEHGLVVLSVDTLALAGDAAPIADLGREPLELGLGRRELAMWLAVALLDLIDCRLQTVTRDGGLKLRTTLEQSIQGSFFGDIAYQR